MSAKLSFKQLLGAQPDTKRTWPVGPQDPLQLLSSGMTSQARLLGGWAPRTGSRGFHNHGDRVDRVV